jgi:hypothetical protein
MDAIKQQIADFFRQRQIDNPKTLEMGKTGGWFEMYRVDTFQDPEWFTYKPLEAGIYSGLTTKLYRIVARTLSSIVAYTANNKWLWLDDHSDDTDFQTFWSQEALASWLPTRSEDLLSLMIETKLNFLGVPVIVHDVQDIPQHNDDMPPELIKEKQQKLATYRSVIQPPKHEFKSGIWYVEFFVWTRIFGRILKVTFQTSPENTFPYQIDEIASNTGLYIVPR